MRPSAQRGLSAPRAGAAGVSRGSRPRVARPACPGPGGRRRNALPHTGLFICSYHPSDPCSRVKTPSSASAGSSLGVVSAEHGSVSHTRQPQPLALRSSPASQRHTRPSADRGHRRGFQDSDSLWLWCQLAPRLVCCPRMRQPCCPDLCPGPVMAAEGFGEVRSPSRTQDLPVNPWAPAVPVGSGTSAALPARGDQGTLHVPPPT